MVVCGCEGMVMGNLESGEGVCCGFGEDVGRCGQCSGCQLGLNGEVVDPGGEGCEGFFGGWC